MKNDLPARAVFSRPDAPLQRAARKSGRDGMRARPGRTKILQRVLAAVALSLLPIAAQVMTASPAAAALSSICKASALPSGYVITGETSSSSCLGNFPNVWLVTEVSGISTAVVCKVWSPIPDGFAIISENSSGGCPGNFPNTWTIKRPSTVGTTVICAVSKIPIGFVVTGEGISGSCPGSWPNTRFISPTTTGGGSAVIRGVGSNRCVDVPGGNRNGGTQVVLYGCHGGVNQKWNHLGSKQLQVFGTLCLDAAGHTAGSKVITYGCHSGTNQQWNLNSNGTISGVQSGLCLDAAGGRTDDGTEIILWHCNPAGSNQRWTRQ
jgi:hypothetical protein